MTSNAPLFSFRRKKESSTEEQPTVVITGCSAGIGEALAIRLAENGWKVFAGVRKEEDAKKLSESHENIKPIFVDVTKQDQVDKAFDEVRNTVGEQGLTALVNNAGLAFPGPAEFVTMDDVERQFQVNVFGLIRVTQAAMPLIRKGTPGRIINIGSIANEFNPPYTSIYNASKGAVHSYSETMRREVARWGIKVVLIKPGYVKTNFSETAVANAKIFKEKFPTGSLCYEYYGKDLDSAEATAEKMGNMMAPASKVVDTIYKAMTVKNPKPMYYDTAGTSFMMGMISITPTSKIDKNFAKTFFKT